MAISCAIFDFDGTLVQSNEIKRLAFYDTVSGWDEARPVLDAILARPDAGDRYAIFAVLHAELAGKIDGLPGVAAWTCAYSRRCEEAIAAAPEIPGASEALMALGAAGIACYVNSATPLDALIAVVGRRSFAPYLRASLGAPASKLQNLESVRAREGVEPSSMVVIGDSEADQVAAAAFGCRFIGIGPDHERFVRPPRELLADLRGLAALLIG